jgi:HAD superfamily hydrolase (TIGR01509 family)
MQPALVIFDCDGVLVDSEPIANAVFAKHLASIGIALTLDQAMARFMGRSMKSCMEDVIAELKSKNIAPPKNFPEEFLAQMQADTFHALGEHLMPVGGIVAALDAIEGRNIAICIASSGDHEKMKMTLGKTGLLERFSGRIFSATQVAKGKPAPDLFLFAAAQMGVQATHCVVVEDSPFGVEAAVAAGMKVLSFCALTQFSYVRSRPGVEQAIAQNKVVEFHSMEKLPELITLA